MGIEQDRSVFSSYQGKANYSPPINEKIWMRIVSVSLFDQDIHGLDEETTGAVEKWSPPEAKKLTEEQIDLIKSEIAGPSRWRDWTTSRPAMWAGEAVAQALDLDTGKDKDRIKQILVNLLRSKVLRKIEGHDSKRNSCLFIVVNDDPKPPQNKGSNIVPFKQTKKGTKNTRRGDGQK